RIGYEVEATGQQVAGLLPCALSIRQAHPFDLFCPQRGKRPTSRPIRAAPCRSAILQAFNQFSRLTREKSAEACELLAARLLSHGRDTRAHLPQVRCHRQKQRAAASDDDAL